jgi:soluble lytic murein transglycosylase
MNNIVKFLKEKWPLLSLVGLSALSLGMVSAVWETTSVFQTADGEKPSVAVPTQPRLDQAPSQVLRLAAQPPTGRTEQLSTLVDQKAKLESYRARYLLATDRINQGQTGEAIKLLDNLEADYTLLAPYILQKRGEAQQAAGDPTTARQTWSTLINQYPEHPAAAAALYEIGKTDGQAWQQLLKSRPDHPRSVEVALKQLQQPIAQIPENQISKKDLLLLVAESGLQEPGYEAVLDQLTQTYGSQLTADQWQMVGFGYWELQRYAKAGKAYSKTTGTPVNRYRAARGLHIGGQQTSAIATYRQLAKEFPKAPETATGLLRMSDLLPKQEALEVLDQVTSQFPDRAGDALAKRADLLEDLNSSASAKATRESLLSQHTGSEAAAELRLANAKRAAKAGDARSALIWAQQVVTHNLQSDVAAEAGFWAGKWALKLNQPDTARRVFEQVIAQHPESYFAWRSAVHLGWDVGDFQTVRSYSPAIRLPEQRLPLPAGSAALQELYQLGQDRDAWALWQTEFDNRQTASVAEQFTDGILRLGIGDNLDGIFKLTSLAWRDQPEDQQAFQALKQTRTYWQGVYPFPFEALIESWSQQRQLNPLLVTALIRQESRFEPKIRSAVGATGLMQVMPSTADWILGKIGETDLNLEDPNDNIRLGTWYLNYTHEEYDNHSLFAVASYNAGPGNVAKWIKRGGYSDVDEFVEAIPFAETKGYVESVFGGYWNYLRLYNPELSERVAQLAKS